MKKKMLTFMLCIIIVCLVVSSLAYADETQVKAKHLSTCTLHFSKQPIRLDSVAAMPDGGVAVIYYAAGTEVNHEEYRLDLFSADGKPIVSKSFCQLKPGTAPSPHAQIILRRDHFLCEYYPDITLMETCYRTAYDYSGKEKAKETKVRLKYGEAFYAESIGDFMLLTQAHAYDEPDASPYRAIEILHIPTEQRVSLSLYDWSSFCPFAGSDGNLYIAQKNEQGHLEIRRYAPAAGMQERIIELGAEYFYGERFAYILSATCMGNLAYLQVRLSNEEAAILTFDLKEGAITASSTLYAAQGSEYIASIRSCGSVLLAVDGHWNEGLQRYVMTVDAINADLQRTPVTLAHECLFILQSDESGNLSTIEMNVESSSFAVCHYSISAP